MKEVEPSAELINYLHEPEKNVAVSARLCYSEDGADKLMEEMTDEYAKNMVDMLTSLGHSSTLEHTYFYFHIVGSRVMTHQLVRKRIASYSQRSQRYVEEDNFAYITPPSIKENNETYNMYKEWMKKGKEIYKELRDKGIPKEDARFALPTIKSNIVVSMNARALLDFFRVRTCNRAQWEIKDIAKQMLEQVKEVAPNIFKHGGPPCITDGYCPEGDMSCGLIDKLKYSDDRLIRHELVANQDRYQCPKCALNVTSLDEIVEHLRKEHDYTNDIVTNFENGITKYYLEYTGGGEN